ncbi:tudor domain-containing protein 1-like [Saccoglossus kowalevskii]|uniref:Tudor domain-containing protein 1-like n=1 Tax=Saccoglossus kowalevskii TaxID=10224 RepID=A0ABM0M6C4_SACKO|nr:PREDICTED: tudor domain-containing protein 1-like [Saccoglossus kowalevskii]
MPYVPQMKPRLGYNSPSSGGGGDASTLSDWDPMKEDYMSPSFNSYNKGPGANLTGSGTPSEVLNSSEDYRGRSRNEHQVYVTGIPKELDKRGLANLFNRAGNVIDVKIMNSKFQDRGDTFGFVTYDSMKGTVNAISQLDGFKIQDCILHVAATRDNDRKNRNEGQVNPQQHRSFASAGRGSLLNNSVGSPNGKLISTQEDTGTRVENHVELNKQSFSRLPRTDGRESGTHRASFGHADQFSNASGNKPKDEGIVSPRVAMGNKSDGSTSLQTTPRPCMKCGKASLQWCSRCMGPYCSVDCQRTHWSQHKLSCNKMQQRSSVNNMKTETEKLVTENQMSASKCNSSVDIPYESVPNKPSFEVLVTEFDNPSSFWCQLVIEKNVIDLTVMMDRMNTLYHGSENQTDLVYTPVINGLCAAQFSGDQGWYRARVLDINPDNTVHVQFVDFGNKELVQKSSLRKLNDEFCQFPIQGLKCSLGGIEPMDTQKGWSDDAKELVKSKLLNQKCSTQYERRMGDTHELWVCDPSPDNHDPGSVINDLMKHLKFAKAKSSKVAEPTQSSMLKMESSRRVILASHLPKLQVKKSGYFPVMCTYIEHPQSFYMKLYDLDQLKRQAAIQEDINDMCKNTAYIAFEPQVDELVCAFCKTESWWYRGIVKAVKGDEALVQYCDFGNHETIPKTLLRLCKQDHSALPIQAVHCTLAGVVPINEESRWTNSAIELFRLKAENKNLVARYVDMVGDKYQVELFDEATNKRMHHEIIKAKLGKSNEIKSNGIDCDLSPTNGEVTLLVESDNVEIDESMVCSVSSVNLPSEFWLQNAYKARELLDLQEDLNLFYNKMPPRLFRPKVGDMCAAKFTLDNNWYRTMVTEIGSSAEFPTVFYIDFGNSETLNVVNLRQLEEQFTPLPMQAMRCRLSNIKPTTKEWIPDAINYFKGKVEGSHVEVKFTGREDNVLSVQMFTPDDKSVSINEDLVKKELALPLGSDEGATSQLPTAESQSKLSPGQIKPNCSMPGGPVQIISDLSLISLPDMDGGFPACVTDITNPEDFYIQLATLEAVSHLAGLMSSIASIYPQESAPRFVPMKDHVCCAKFSEDQAWYRAVVKDTTENNQIRVQFIDFGNYGMVSVDDIQSLDPQISSTPVLAVHCSLDGVTGRSENNNWSTDAIQLFASKVLNEQCTLKIVKEGNPWNVELYCKDDTKSINQQLIEEYLANKKMPPVPGQLAIPVQRMFYLQGKIIALHKSLTPSMGSLEIWKLWFDDR